MISKLISCHRKNASDKLCDGFQYLKFVFSLKMFHYFKDCLMTKLTLR